MKFLRPGAPLPAAGRLRILPTRYGWFFLLVLLGMMLGSANYGNNLGFLITFLLAGMAAASVLAGLSQTRRTALRFTRAAPVFAGQPACFIFSLHAPAGAPAVELCFPQQPAAFCGPADVPAGPEGGQARVCHATPRRGLLRPAMLQLSTVYPLGLFSVRRRLPLNGHAGESVACLVYPAPAGGAVPLLREPGGQGSGGQGGPGVEEFKGLRPYAPGDPMQRIAWKASQRGQGLLTKEFEGQRGGAVLLDFEALAPLPLEERLSRLCRMALEAHSKGEPFSLRLPERSLGPGAGEAHLHACLKALALHGGADA